MLATLLNDRVAVVTGGGSGIGRAISKTFAASGAKVVIADNKLEGAEMVAAEIGSAGGTAMAVPMDVTNRAAVTGALETTLRRFSRVDILVNNAGIFHREAFLDHAEASWRRILDVNLTGYFLCSQVFGRKMVELKTAGRIINIASIVALDGGTFRYLAGYNASKGGTIALTKTIALEMAPHGITVNAICPGAIDTPMTHSTYVDPVKAREMVRYVPLGRAGTPEDVAKGALFLSSGLADYVTGHVLVIDGGWTIGQLPNENLGI